jgi:hypothetical protein
VGDQRHAGRRTRAAPRRARRRAPFGFPAARGSRSIDHLDGTIGQGIGRFQLSVTDAADPLEGADLAARLRHVWRCRRPSARGAGRRARRDLPLDEPAVEAARDALAAARKALADLQIPSTLVMKERPSNEPPSFELRVRGSFSRRPSACPPARRGAAPVPRRSTVNRLGLARWLVDANNPLVARVAVNRLWEQIFGRGLVETSEDFGSQGRRRRIPSCSTGWPPSSWQRAGARKRCSARSCCRPPTGSRQPSRRSSPSAIRTTGCSRAVRVSAWRPRWFATSRSRPAACSARRCSARASSRAARRHLEHAVQQRQVDDEHGEDRYRRSLYTFWRRTSPYPSFMTFDATSREFCTVRRVRTNTPLQALTLLNDPASFEAARALAGG